MNVTFGDIAVEPSLDTLEDGKLRFILDEAERKCGSRAAAVRYLDIAQAQADAIFMLDVPKQRAGRNVLELSVEEASHLSLMKLKQRIRAAVVNALDDIGVSLTQQTPSSYCLERWLDKPEREVRRYRELALR